MYYHKTVTENQTAPDTHSLRNLGFNVRLSYLAEQSWTSSTRLALILTFLTAIGVFYTLQWTSIWAQPGANCSSAYFIDETLPSGGRWQMCWEHRHREGIVLHEVYYTPPNGASQRVLDQAGLAQIHVPYDDNGARFHDLTDLGLGSNRLNNLTSAECPGGTLLTHDGKNALCQQIRKRGYAYKSGGQQVQGYALNLFSVSTIGAYNYIIQWRFLDDGTIEPSVGATGRLQRRGSEPQHGWPINSSGTIGISHIHNYYWRLDVGIGDNGNNDVVEEFEFAPASSNTRRTRTVTRLTTETSRSVDPARMRSWRVRDVSLANSDGHLLSYHLEPLYVGHRDVGPSFEPWTFNDLYVTTYKSCEKYASHNPQVDGCGDNVTEFVTGENIDGADIVLWYGITFHHIPRDEDEQYMHAHWDGFRLVPRDWTSRNPLAPGNTPPTLTNPGTQTNNEGDSVTLSLDANDVDGDDLTFSGSNLPPGLTLNSSTGLIGGVISANSANSYNVTVSVSDGSASTDANFIWNVLPSGGGNCGGLSQEAENGVLSGEFVVGNDGAASGGQYIHVPNGGSNRWNGPDAGQKATYCVQIDTAGTYRIHGWAYAETGSDNSFYVQVDNNPINGYIWDFPKNTSYLQDYVSDRNGADPVEVTLSAGEHTLDIFLRENGARLDRLALELVDSEPPPPSECVNGTIEGEDGEHSGAFIVGNDNAASAGQYVHTPDGSGNSFNAPNPGQKVEYCFQVNTAGTYALKGWVYAATGRDNSFFVQVDGSPSSGYLWDFAKNTSYIQDYVSDRNGADPITVNLSSGEHIVTVYLREDGARLDRLSLEASVQAAQQAPTRLILARGLYGTLRVADGEVQASQNEPNLAGILLTLIDVETQGKVYREIVETDRYGHYYFDEMPIGEYVLSVTLPTGYTSTQPTEQILTVYEHTMVEASYDLLFKSESKALDIEVYLPIVAR